jgi:hypothetical protein
MINAEHSFDLPVAPAEAFALLSDPVRDPEWQSACVHTRLLDGPPRAGGQYEITFQMVGRRMTFIVEITAYEPGHRSAFRVVDGPFGYTGAYTYTERPGGSTGVHWTFDVDPGSYFGVMPLSLVKKLLISQVKKDSGKLAAQLTSQARPRA